MLDQFYQQVYVTETITAWAADQVGCFYTSLSVAGDKSWNEG